MFASFSQSWALTRDSWRVVRSDREILLFPLLGGFGVVLVTLLFAVPLALTNLSRALDSGRPGTVAIAIVVLWAFLYCQTVVLLFAQSAVVGAAMIRLQGGDPTVGDGLRTATSRFHLIAGYAAISATVGVLLQVIDALLRSAEREAEKEGNVASMVAAIIGTLVTALVGAAWSVATYFVVPVMIIEGIGPIASIRRSTRLIRDFWGESAVATVGLGFVFALIYLAVGVVGIGLGVTLLSANLVVPGIALLVVTAVAFGIIALIQTALRGVFVAALYRYAVGGAVSSMYFEPELLRSTFVPRGAVAAA